MTSNFRDGEFVLAARFEHSKREKEKVKKDTMR